MYTDFYPATGRNFNIVKGEMFKWSASSGSRQELAGLNPGREKQINIINKVTEFVNIYHI